MKIRRMTALSRSGAAWGLCFLCLVATGAGAPETRIPQNRALGPPADPLLPVRDNRPSAAEMAGHPRQHPYLFFDAASREALRAKERTEPFHSFAAKLRASAEKDLTVPIPPLPQVFEGIPRFLPDGSFNPEEIQHHYDDFYHQAYLVKDIVPTLGFCYQLTGDRRFGDAGKAWLLNYAGRQKLARKDREADFDAANVAFGMALGYDWLAELLSEPERRLVQGALMRLAGPMAAAGEKLLSRADPQRNRSSYGNNHQTRTNGLFGLSLLALLYEVPQAAQWLDMEIQLQRDRLYPSAWAPDGEYVDGWDHFDSSLDDPIPFVVALGRMGGEDWFHDPRLAARFGGIARYYLYGLEERFGGPSKNFGWLALAGQLRDPVAQWIATRDDGLKRVDPLFAYLFFDPTVTPQAPSDPAGSVYFPYSGMVKLCSDWSANGVLVPFRCGPQIGKDLGDQNGFRLRAGGEWLLPRLPTEWEVSTPPLDYHWALQAWFRAAAQNVIVVDPAEVGDFAEYKETGKIPLRGGIQSAVWSPQVKLRGYEWLSGPETLKSGDLRTVQFDPAVDYVCGEAHRAYVRLQPALWVRQVLFVKAAGHAPAYVLVCDEVDAGAKPETVAWQVMSGLPFAESDHALKIRGEKAALEIRFLAPADARIVRKETPAPEEQRTPFVQWTSAGPEKKCFFLTALVPRLAGDRSAPSFRVLPAAGGWAVEVTSDGGTDLALFRAEGAASVSCGSAATDSSAALLRQSRGVPGVLYRLGR